MQLFAKYPVSTITLLALKEMENKRNSGGMRMQEKRREKLKGCVCQSSNLQYVHQSY